MRVSFTIGELLYIDDSLKGSVDSSGDLVYSPPGADGLGTQKKFMFSVGRAILNLLEIMDRNKGKSGDAVEKEETTLEVTEDELWLLKEIAISTTLRGEEPVGLNLKMKIYTTLRILDSEDVFQDFSFTDTEKEDLTKADIKDRLKTFMEPKEENDANKDEARNQDDPNNVTGGSSAA